MNAEYSVEEVRARFEEWIKDTSLYRAHGESYFATGECAYAWRVWQAAYAERIKADEGAVTKLIVDTICNAALGHDNYGYETQDRVHAALLAIWPNPPAQAAQVAQGEAVAWHLRIGSSNTWSVCDTEALADFYGRQSGTKYEKRPLYTTPPAQPAERVVEGKLVGYVWPGKADYDHLHRCLGEDGDLEVRRIPSGAVGVYAMLAAATSPGESS